MSIFYTKKGDGGRSYVGKKVINKTCLEIEALGQLDELNSMIGVLKSLPAGQAGEKIPRNLKSALHQVQENLFIIQANVAAVILNGKFKVPKFESSKVKEAEKIIDGIEKKLKPARRFIISGTDHTSAWLEFLRAKSRNVERSVLRACEKRATNAPTRMQLNQEIKKYLNRLSSLFFALARWEARDKKEQHPQYK